MNSNTKSCKVDGCEQLGRYIKGKYYLTKGMCAKHYSRLLNGLNPDCKTEKDPRPAIIEGDVAKIPLGLNAKDGYAIVDKKFAYLADECNWGLSSAGYVRNNNHNPILLHHCIIGLPPKGKLVDHIDRNPINNLISNLRIGDKILNSINREKPKSNTSGYKGVYYNGYSWYVRITSKGEDIYGGSFKNKQEAAKKYNELALKHHGKFVVLNEVE